MVGLTVPFGTALILAFFGAPMLPAGAPYAARTLALLVALASLRGVFDLIGGEVSPATMTQLGLFVACVAYLVVVVRGMVAGRGPRPRGA